MTSYVTLCDLKGKIGEKAGLEIVVSDAIGTKLLQTDTKKRIKKKMSKG